MAFKDYTAPKAHLLCEDAVLSDYDILLVSDGNGPVDEWTENEK